MQYTLKEAAEILGVHEMTLRRRIKTGKLKAELVDGPRGQQYMLDEIDVYPSTSVIPVVKVTQELDLIQLEQRLQSIITTELAQMIKEGYKAEQVVTTESIAELKAEIAELKEIILENQRNWMEARQEKPSFWRRIFSRRGDGNGQ